MMNDTQTATGEHTTDEMIGRLHQAKETLELVILELGELEDKSTQGPAARMLKGVLHAHQVMDSTQSAFELGHAVGSEAL